MTESSSRSGIRYVSAFSHISTFTLTAASVEPDGREPRTLRVGHQLGVVPAHVYHPVLEQDRRLQEQASEGMFPPILFVARR
jgi:hypothetical protein